MSNSESITYRGEMQSIDGIFESELAKYDLSGYIPNGNPVVKTIDGKDYSIQEYQKPHEDEYTKMEVENGIPNGIAQLYEDGMLQLSWRMVNGKRDGVLTIYKDGMFSRMTRWKDLDQALNNGRIREVVNDEDGDQWMVEKVVESGIVVFRGEYDKKTLSKEGYGVEYDEESGDVKSAGYYRDDKLVHICQKFVKDTNGEIRMREFDGDEDVDNVKSNADLVLVYVGGYRFDENMCEFVRCGSGMIMENGACTCIVEYDEKGVEIEGRKRMMIDGWNGERDGKRRRKESENVIACPGLNLSYPREIDKIVIGDNSMNDDCGDISKMKLDLSEFKQLKKIDIGNECFKNVREFVLDGLEKLESVKIGRKCFRISNKEERDDGLLRITNCSNLTQLEIGSGSFKDFKQFELSNVNSLQSITFGEDCFKNVHEFVLDGLDKLESVKIGRKCFRISDWERRDDGMCRITNCPNLTQLEIGYRSFEDFKQFELLNVNSLQSINFGYRCFYYAENCILKGE